MILKEAGRNQPDVTLDHIVNNLLLFFNGFECLHEAKRMIEKKCDIKKEPVHKCWSEDDIKRAWKEAIKEDIKSSTRKHWARVIMLQVVKSFVCEMCKQNAAQKNSHGTTDEQGSVTIPDSEDRSSQSKAELETEGAAGGVEQMLGKGKKISKVSIKAGSKKGNSEDRSSQSSDELKTLGAARGVQKISKSKCKSSKCGLNQTGSETIYIRIPVTEMFGSGPGVTQHEVQPVPSPYKLINGFPSDTDIRKRKSYVMSFSNLRRNAEWVYEILNRETLKDNCEVLEGFENNYVKGHLAAAANHRWCREAKNDANLFSNIIPQNEKLNNGIWKKMENGCRAMFQNDNEIRNVHVYSGPIYMPNHIWLRNKAVPDFVFKVIIVENMDGTVKKPMCYVMPNRNPDSENLRDYEMDIDDFQTRCGLRFIEHCPNANVRDNITTVTLQGEDGNGQSCSVDIGVIISS